MRSVTKESQEQPSVSGHYFIQLLDFSAPSLLCSHGWTIPRSHPGLQITVQVLLLGYLTVSFLTI